MATKRKAVKDRPNHREKVDKWHARTAKRTAKKVAARLLGKQGWVTLPPIGQYPVEVEVGLWQSLASGDGR